MCVTKVDPKTLEKICKEAADADKSIEEKAVESFNYEYVDWRGKIPYIPGPNERGKKKKSYDPDGT